MFENPLMETILPEKIRESFEVVHQLESLQFLRDLGYLEGKIHSSPQKLNPKAFREAILEFRNELEQLRAVDPEAYGTLLENLLSPVPEAGDEVELSADEVQILKNLMSLEGTLTISKWEDEEQIPLIWRVIRFRLGLLGSIEEGEADTAVCRRELNRIQNWFHIQNTVETINLIGDLSLLIPQVLHVPSIFSKDFLGVGFFSWSEKLRTNQMLKKERGKQFLETLGAYTSADLYARFKGEIVEPITGKQNKNAVKQRLNTLKADKFNRFLIRLLQLYLWAEGYLNGSPATDWDKQSQEALEEILKSLHESKETQKDQIHRLQVHLTGGIGAFNFQFFWKAVSQPDSAEKADNTSLFLELQTLDEEGQGKEAKRIRKELEQSLRELPGKIREQLKQGIPIYHGGRFSGVFQKIRDNSNSIWNALDRYHSSVKNGMGNLLNMLKQAFRFLDQSLELLLNRKGFETGGVHTRFDPTWDAVHRVPLKTDPAALSDHLSQLKLKRVLMERSAQIVGQVVRWSIQIASGTVTWVVIGIQIAKFLLKQFLEWKRENAILRKAILGLTKQAIENIDIETA